MGRANEGYQHKDLNYSKLDREMDIDERTAPARAFEPPMAALGGGYRREKVKTHQTPHIYGT